MQRMSDLSSQVHLSRSADLARSGRTLSAHLPEHHGSLLSVIIIRSSRQRMIRNSVRGMVTSAIWKTTYRACVVTFVLILMSSSSKKVADLFAKAKTPSPQGRPLPPIRLPDPQKAACSGGGPPQRFGGTCQRTTSALARWNLSFSPRWVVTALIVTMVPSSSCTDVGHPAQQPCENAS